MFFDNKILKKLVEAGKKKNKPYGDDDFTELAKIEYALTISAGEKLDDPNAKERSGANLDFSKPNLVKKA